MSKKKDGTVCFHNHLSQEDILSQSRHKSIFSGSGPLISDKLYAIRLRSVTHACVCVSLTMPRREAAHRVKTRTLQDGCGKQIRLPSPLLAVLVI